MIMDDYLCQLPFWHDLMNEEKTIAEQGTTIRKYKKGTYIDGFNDACLGMIHVIKGSIRVYMSSEEGREITLFHICEGESCILSATCVIGEISFEVQLMTEEETEIIAVHAAAYQEIIEKNIKVRCFSFELATNRFSSVVWVLQQILFAHFDERMARFLLNEYGKTGTKKIRMTQELIAKEVNSAGEVVARMLRQFADEGWIEVERGAINIKDLDALRKLAK